MQNVKNGIMWSVDMNAPHFQLKKTGYNSIIVTCKIATLEIEKLNVKN